jgi:hypothetical protein
MGSKVTICFCRILMKQLLKKILVASLLVGALVSVPSLGAADGTPNAPEKTVGRAKDATEKGKPKRDWYPFGGIVASVDSQANTISLKKKEGVRLLKLDSKSALEIDGKSAVVGSVKVGTYAHGKLHKDTAGNEVITAAKFDKEPPSKKKEAAGKEPRKTPAPK